MPNTVPVNDNATVTSYIVERARRTAVVNVFPIGAITKGSAGEELHRRVGRYAAQHGVDVLIGEGEFVAVQGPSGSGKSTLLQLLGALDRPTSGSVRFAGKNLEAMSDQELTELRRNDIGFVFQQFNLIPTLTAVENVELPLLYTGTDSRDRRARLVSCRLLRI